MDKKDLKISVKTLVALIDEGYIRLTPLVHGLDALCMAMLQNDFSTYRRLMDALEKERKELSRRLKHQPDLREFRQGYLDKLNEASQRIGFWKMVATTYYEDYGHVDTRKRLLANGRKLVVKDQNRSDKGKDNQHDIQNC